MKNEGTVVAETEGMSEAVSADDCKIVDAISPKAWGWYNNPLVLGGIRPRGLFPLALAYDVARAVKRSLTQTDLEFIIQKDGEIKTCMGCEREFQPVRWLKVNANLISALRSGLEFGQLNGQANWFGSHIVHVDGKSGVPSLLLFCGPMYYFDPSRHDATGAEFYAVNQRSCLGKAYLCAENRDARGGSYPARDYSTAVKLIDKMDQNHQALIALRTAQKQRELEMKSINISRAFGHSRERIVITNPKGKKRGGIHGGCRQADKR